MADDSTANRASTDYGWYATARTTLGQQRWSMLELVYGSGLSQRQIADQLGVSRDLVRSEIARSMQVVCQLVTAAA